MINLIPKKEKRRMAIDFYSRVALLALLTLNVCILIFGISLLPSYFISLTKVKVIDRKIEIQNGEALPLLDEQSLSLIKDINTKIDLIQNAENKKFIISDKIINPVLSQKGLSIKITEILYQNDVVLGKKISITGVANSRQDLLSFRQALENDKHFKDVELPISNFVQDININFYLTLIPA